MNLKTPKEISVICKRSAQYIHQELLKDPPVLTIIVKGKTTSGKQRVRVDLDGKLTQKFIRSRLGHIPTNAIEVEKNKTKKKTVPKKRKREKKEDEIPTEETDLLIESYNPYNGKAATGETKILKDKKLAEEIEKIKIDNEQKRGSLIDKKLIVFAFSRLSAIDENQLRGLNVRVCPKIIALDAKRNAEKSDEILELIDKKIDPHLKTEIAKILNSGESEKSSEIAEIIEEDTGKVLKNIQREFKDCLELMDKQGK